MLKNKYVMKVRNAIFLKQKNNLEIHFYEDNGKLRNLIAVPPSVEFRKDVYMNGKYYYDYSDNIKKIKNSFILIEIQNNKIQNIKYFKK